MIMVIKFSQNEHYHLLNNNELVHFIKDKDDKNHQNINMSFWENVEEELKFQNKTRKQLAKAVGFDTTTISKGLTNQSIPSADVALKIAYFLNVSVESLLDFPARKKKKNAEEEQKQIRYYKKYFNLISQAEHLNEQQLKAIENLIKTI